MNKLFGSATFFMLLDFFADFICDKLDITDGTFFAWFKATVRLFIFAIFLPSLEIVLTVFNLLNDLFDLMVPIPVSMGGYSWLIFWHWSLQLIGVLLSPFMFALIKSAISRPIGKYPYE